MIDSSRSRLYSLIGHALIGEALYAGIEETVRAYRRIVDATAHA